MGRRAGALPDGTINGLRWVPTKDGVALALTNCGACHVLYLPDDTAVAGASSFAMPNSFRNGVGGDIREAERTLPGETPFQFAGPIGSWAYQSYGTPWVDDPAGEALKDMTEEEYNAWIGAGIAGGGVARWNGSILYPAKIPDLIGFRDRKYIDHTATHAHRSIGDRHLAPRADRRRAPRRGWFAVSRAVSNGARQSSGRGMGQNRFWSQGQILPHHRRWPPTPPQ
jgi:hypothetical protein